MLYMSVPMGLTTLKGMNELKFVRANLSPHVDSMQAQQDFTKLIKEAHGSLAVKFNFWVHTAAQYFSNGNVGVAHLPQTERITVRETGRPFEFRVEKYEKRINQRNSFVFR